MATRLALASVGVLAVVMTAPACRTNRLFPGDGEHLTGWWAGVWWGSGGRDGLRMCAPFPQLLTGHPPRVAH